MASEGEKKHSQTSSHPPPPYDPFPTYQTPFPRNSKDEENPFIQFRRFADEQLQSLFSGVPQLFGFSSPDAFRKEFEDMMTKRHQMEEGWRKQFEQEVEEMKQAFQKEREQSEKPNDTHSPWWLRGNAAKCPALNGEEMSEKARTCPALFDKSGAPKTELDAYDRLEQARTPSSALQDELKERRKRRGWLTGLGWDGNRVRDQRTSQVDESDGPQPEPWTSTRPMRYTRFHARRMDPFDDPNDTIPWVMLSPYSPVYLCNPQQPRMFKVHIQDSEGMPMQISRPRFCGTRNPSEVDEKMAKLPWADAFEDLVSLQQTGSMIDRDYSTYRTPSTWIHDMVHRGSLGPRWGFNEEGQLTRSGQKRSVPFTARKQIEGNPNQGELATTRSSEEGDQDEDRNAKEAFVRSMISGMEEAEKIMPSLAPLWRQIWHSPEEIFSAINKVEVAGREALEKVQATMQEAIPEANEEQNAPNPPPSWSSSSSSSASSWSNFDSRSHESDSIVSTLTKTESRTLPDGSVETRRVLKRRFADGREEGEESVDIQPAATEKSKQMVHRPQTQSSNVDRHTQTFTPVQDEVKKQQRKGGWFWN